MDSVEKTDRTITCKDCRQPFNFSLGEQQFFESRQLHDPVRCKACREIKKQQKDAQGY